MLHITIVTLFPQMFAGPFNESIIKRAAEKGLLSLDFVNIRDFATDAYKSVDDHPYGGGHGMIMRVDIVDRAITAAKQKYPTLAPHTVLMDPQGTPYSQEAARRLSATEHCILVCGHYEGVDERIRSLVDEEISIGDYVLTGGEIPAMVITDSIVRLVPGVLRKTDSSLEESFSSMTLEYPQYTRPETYKKLRVPDTLLSGDHAAINAWRKSESEKRTKVRRPDLTPKSSGH